MKILHVIDQVGIEYGGSAVVPRKLTKALAKLGHDVTTYASDAGVNGGVPDVVNLHSFNTVASIKDSLRITPAMLFADYDFDVIHCHNYYTFQNLFARLRHSKVPMVLQPHGTFVMYDDMIKKRPTQQLIDWPWRKWFLGSMKKIICVSGIEIHQAVKLGLTRRIVKIPNGIDLAEFKELPAYGEFRRKYKFNDSDKIILYIGRYHWMKGLDKLFEAYKQVRNKNKRLVVIGAKYHSEYDGVVELPPMYGRDKLSAMVDSDVLVLPSIYEIFGITPLEAMACGTPAVITSNCGLSSYCNCKDGEPMVVDIEWLSAPIESELHEPTKELFSDERIKFVSKFAWDIIARQVEGVYHEAIGNGNNSGV